MLGTFILWFGWYGFNAGSAIKLDSELLSVVIGKALINTTLSGASSGLVALLVNLFISERKTGEPMYKLSAAMNGCLAGLAASSGSCGVIEPWAAIVIGTVAGLLYLLACALLDKYYIDDAVDAIPVHLVGGAWGVLATGLFASPRGMQNMYGTAEHVGWFYSWGRSSGDFALMGCQIIGLLFILAWTTVVMFPFFSILNYMGIFRSDSLEELVGLDVSYHGYAPHALDGEVTEEELREYFKHNRGNANGIRIATDDDDEADSDNVNRFG